MTQIAQKSVILSRRNLLRAGGCLLVALTVPRVALAQDTGRVLAKDQLDGFLAIDWQMLRFKVVKCPLVLTCKCHARTVCPLATAF